jgi:hypothetical protein
MRWEVLAARPSSISRASLGSAAITVECSSLLIERRQIHPNAPQPPATRAIETPSTERRASRMTDTPYPIIQRPEQHAPATQLLSTCRQGRGDGHGSRTRET